MPVTPSTSSDQHRNHKVEPAAFSCLTAADIFIEVEHAVEEQTIHTLMGMREVTSP